MRARRRGGSADARRALFATFAMACASAACASTAANATVEVSNATSTSGDLGDPLLSLARDPSLPRELRARVRAASRELADAGLATLAATALETYGGAAEAARHLAAVRAAVTTACGSERGTWDDADDRPESEPEPGAVVSRPASFRDKPAADLPLPKTVSRLARNLAKLFSWLAEEHDARLSRASGVTSDHLWSLADHLRESDVVLGRFFDARKLASVSFSCFRREGYVTRSVVSRGAIALPFDALVRAARTWYVREIKRCGLADRERDFERSRTRAVDGSSSTSAALAKFARAAESCRRAGTGGVFDGVFDERNAAAAAELAELRAHYAAMDVALTAAVEREDCLAARKPTRRRDDASDGENDDASDGENDDASDGENDDASDENAFRESVPATETNASSHSFDSLLPALDPETDERRGGRLATGALTLSFLVGAAEDVVATRGGCAAAVDAPVGSYYPVRAYDRVAQEMARCGLDGVSREWLAREWGPAGGSHAFAATLDEFQAAADACVSESGSKSGTYRDARRHAVRADGARLRSIAEHFRRAESALLGCRGGRRAYSAAGRLADTLEGFRDVLEAGGCLYDESPAGNAVEPSQENAVEPSQAARRAREANSESESVSVDADESVSVDADESVSVDADSNGASSGLSAWGAMGVGALAGAIVVAVAWAVNRACGGGGGGARKKPTRIRTQSEGDGGGGGASGSLAAGSARRFYRHLEAGSAGDLPLVEDLDRGSDRGSDRGASPRPSSTLAGLVPGASLFFKPATRKRSHSISEPAAATRPPLAVGGGASAGAGAVTVTRAESRRHRHAREEAFRVDIDAPTAWRREWGESDSSGPSAPPGTGSGTSPRGGDDPRAF